MYRARLKEQHPEKYNEMLKKAKERNQHNRDKRKERFETEPQTRALLIEKQNFLDKERYVDVYFIQFPPIIFQHNFINISNR